MSFLSDSVDALWRGLLSAAGTTIDYAQDATTLQLSAIPGATRTETEFDTGEAVSDRSVDFIVSVADMGVVEPRIGDVITWNGLEYEVLGLGLDRQYREITPYRKLYRIHTKESA